MNKILFFLFVSTLICKISSAQSVKNKKLNCKDFRTGKFEINIDTIKVEIERSKKFQYEKVSSIGSAKYKITWPSNCEYVLELVETNISIFKDIPIGTKYYVKIIKTDGNSCFYQSTASYSPNSVVEGTINKVKSN
ncbi:MAG: hypothetical protein V4667_03750 [Bacteroidota bacterium]